jgi:small subunit ribosomal protein S13
MYLAETELKDNLKVSVSLTKIYGIKKKNASIICKSLGFADDLKVFELNYIQKEKLSRFITSSSLIINTELKKKNSLINQKLIDIKSYKGLRRLKGYPVRGQRTRSNAKTAKKTLKN